METVKRIIRFVFMAPVILAAILVLVFFNPISLLIMFIWELHPVEFLGWLVHNLVIVGAILFAFMLIARRGR